MPIYEYRCNVCNHQFDLRQKFSDPPADRCPKCGGVVHKMVSAAAFSLKGGGWFGDGYNEKAEAPRAEADTAAGSGTAAEAAPAEAAPAEAAPAETTASPATPTPAPGQPETKNSGAATPAAGAEKAKSK